MKLARMLAALTVGTAMAGCTLTPARDVSVSTARSPLPRSAAPAASTPTAPPVRLVAWHGPVEQLFVHPLVLRPRLAFTTDSLGQGFADYFITAREFGRILDQLWRNGWTLVDPRRVAAGDVRVPPGRKPLVLQEDDVNYYAYFNGRGLASRLVVAPDGTVKAEYDGRLTDEDVVPMTDAEVALHPEFSADGAKGLLAVTAYEGFFGEHNLKDPAARQRLQTLVRSLESTGWVIASHTYGHINLSADSLSVIARDTARWKAAAAGLLGPVNILVYPFGARPDATARKLLRDAGFTVQYDIDVRPARWTEDGVVMMSRRHVDGYAFANPTAMASFFSVKAVRDPLRP